ncbi:zeta toxin family protein [Candidatus Dojkabacteria bacterium]|jgi:hypothetical protein|nr:zeta toxin family protein [Candidatus Dojkabacteria bacterium]
MNINEEFEHLLTEGVRDKGIFKAVFLGGGPGSGKDYVLKHTLDGHGLTEINADKAHEYLTHKDILKPDNVNQKRIKSTKELRQLLAIQGRNGLIVNGTHDDYKHTNKIKKHLEDLGYDTSMVHVHADDEVSRKRNVERGQKGGRTVHEKSRKDKWDAVQESRRHHAKNFGGNYHEFDNSVDLRNAPPEVVKQKRDELIELKDHIHNFVNTPSTSEHSQKWIEKSLKDDQDPIPRKGTEKLPHPESNASQQATELGLQYYGKGRYGKGGKVTHHAISDNLTELDKEKDKPKPKKKLSEFYKPLNESVSITITGDSVDDVNDLFQKLLKGKDEEYSLSDKQDSLTLGKKSKPVGESSEGTTLTHADVVKMLGENINLVSVKPKHKPGYFSEIYKKLRESIDQGIESGLSMATSGENLCRDSGEQIHKDGKVGKAKKKIQELTGDETTASIGTQKEDELKKKGISLSSFRPKRVI